MRRFFHLGGDGGRPRLQMETWVVMGDGGHKAFTDMVLWRGCFWLVFVSSPSHFASRWSRLLLLRSTDARHWQVVRLFDGGGKDIRDPKLGVFQDRIFLYALLNRRFDPEPYTTVVARSDDGTAWGEFEETSAAGWLIGRPLRSETLEWHAPAHHIDLGIAALMRSSDGLDWTIRSTISNPKTERADETSIHLLKDGRMLAVTRVEAGSGVFGSSRDGTLVSASAFPYTSWTRLAMHLETRLDGPNMFDVDGRVYAVGRRQCRIADPFLRQGSALARKRTALFRVGEDTGGLAHIADLPSCGDTSYAGVAAAAGKVFISYYTNDPRRDYPWVVGMSLPTRIQISAIDIASLSKQGESR